MFPRIINPPQNKSFFLFGPRGTGKTTWVKTAYPKAVYINLLDSETHKDLLASPNRLEGKIPLQYQGWVIIDEIQRVPELLNEVHRLIEDKKYKFILTGSSARKLRAKGVNLLAGRALMYAFHPLTIKEIGGAFNLKNSLLHGHLPSTFTEDNPQKYLASYVNAYLREEVQQEGLTRNLSDFARFLEAASFSQGSVLNISEIARECAVERKVVENYFSILEDLMIAYRVPVFIKKAKRRMIAHSKFYFFDAGVYRAIRPQGPVETNVDMEGPALETLLFQELHATNDLLDLGYKMYYWRTAHQQEVDFILYGARGIKAFEIKRTARFSHKYLTGLKAFIKDYPMARGYLLYGGRERLYFDKIEVLPIVEALKNLENLLK